MVNSGLHAHIVICHNLALLCVGKNLEGHANNRNYKKYKAKFTPSYSRTVAHCTTTLMHSGLSAGRTTVGLRLTPRRSDSLESISNFCRCQRLQFLICLSPIPHHQHYLLVDHWVVTSPDQHTPSQPFGADISFQRLIFQKSFPCPLCHATAPFSSSSSWKP